MAGPIRVYFDHNVVDHAVKRHKITDGQVDRLRSIGKGGIFQLTLSITNLDEIIAGLQSRRPERPEQAIEQLRLIRDVIGFAYLLKPPDQLLTHALFDFAFDLPPRESVIVMPTAMREHLERLADATRVEIEYATQIAAEVRGQIDENDEALRRAREQALRELEGRRPKQHFIPYWRDVADGFAEGYAGHVGVWERCRERGMDRLLAVPCMAMAIGAAASMVYAKLVEGRATDRGDSRDQAHAIAASTADIFVSNDDEFRQLLKRVPMIAPAVMSLEEFLASS